MFNKLEFYIALRYLKSKKSEKFISVVSIFSLLGIALGVAALIVVMSVMNGFRIELTKKIVAFDGDIAVFSDYGSIENYGVLAEKINSLNEINFAFPMIEKQGLVSTNSENSTRGVQIRAISLEDLKHKDLISKNIIHGKIDNFDSGFKVIIGRGLSSTLGAVVGDDIKIITSQTADTIFGQIPRFKTFSVIGIFDSGMYDYDSISIFMPLSTAQIFFKMKDQVNTIEIHSKSPLSSNITKYKVMDILENKFGVNDWQNKNMSLFQALKTERVVMFLILTLIILVAALNIISGLVMLVKDKTHDIAILRTMGTSRASIIKIFLIAGFTLGLTGTILGVTIGVSFAVNIEKIKLFLESLTNTTLFNPLVYYLSELPSQVEMIEVGQIALFALFLSLSATLYPAWKAATINPVETLRS